ncbi:MAG: MotA/TolQ/ExbB proton channel family protein [Bacteroidales bacterium]|nr:MotA/TolQ/ExbB proton channel family protein [Bacteroidales bacterium]
MQSISKVLFGIANSLLVPDIVLLIVFFVWAVVLLGATYGAYMARRRNARLLDEVVKELSVESMGRLKETLPQCSSSMFVSYLSDVLSRQPDEGYGEWILNRFETESFREINTARLLAKVGPVLGLMGTLISMSPALVGLSSGDISGMAYNMQVVFATTVVGLVVSIVGLFVQQLKQRWLAKDVNDLERVIGVWILSSKQKEVEE